MFVYRIFWEKMQGPQCVLWFSQSTIQYQLTIYYQFISTITCRCQTRPLVSEKLEDLTIGAHKRGLSLALSLWFLSLSFKGDKTLREVKKMWACSLPHITLSGKEGLYSVVTHLKLQGSVTCHLICPWVSQIYYSVSITCGSAQSGARRKG